MSTKPARRSIKVLRLIFTSGQRRRVGVDSDTNSFKEIYKIRMERNERQEIASSSLWGAIRRCKITIRF